MVRTGLPIVLCTVFFLSAACTPNNPASVLPYQNPQIPLEERVEDLLARMTPQEKARFLAGSGWMESYPIERLGIPAIKMADGPMGVRNWVGSSSVTNSAEIKPVLATAFPAGIAMAATWNVEMVYAEAQVIAQQVKALGRDMILAPCVNIARTPLWGRNFEGYGEDPYLAARMTVAYVRGVQDEKVIPSVKHFAANNQEFERHRVDAIIDPRTLHEIYFPAFRAAVEEGDAWGVMNAYNKVNGKWCSESAYLLSETLRGRWGFEGFVVSDWGSTYDTAGTINAGMDLEMPGGEPMRRWFAKPSFQQNGNGAGWLTEEKVLKALANGELEQSAVDRNVRNILRVMFKAELFDHPHTGGGEVDTPEQRAVARQAATQSMVLLKNKARLLPLDATEKLTLAVIGPSAASARTGGGGSSHVRPKYAITPLDGIKEAAGDAVDIRYALGAAMEGEEEGLDPDEALDEAATLAARSDVAVVVVGYSADLEREGFDRPSMELPAGQTELIQAVAAANDKTVIIVAAGSPIAMTGWIDQVGAVLFAWYGGQEAGQAVGDLLFGHATPTAKLPITFPARIEDSPAHGNYPGENLRVEYAEGIYVGYRGFDTHDVEPLFPFGFGLSYTTYKYSGLELSTDEVKSGEAVEVSLQVENTGHRAGTEVVQLYLRDLESSLDRPVKELKGFGRVSLEPGQSETVSFTIDTDAMSFFDSARDDWVAEAGTFEVLVGASSRDIRLRGKFRLID